MTLTIIEAGVNYNGTRKLAKELIDAFFTAGADVVKFQSFQANQLATGQAEQASYQTKNLGHSQMPERNATEART